MSKFKEELKEELGELGERVDTLIQRLGGIEEQLVDGRLIYGVSRLLSTRVPIYLPRLENEVTLLRKDFDALLAYLKVKWEYTEASRKLVEND